MKNRWKKFLQICKDPPAWVLTCVYLLAVVSGLGAILCATLGVGAAWFVYLSYALYAVAAVTLGYAVYTLIRFAPKIKAWFLEFIERYDFTRSLVRNFGFRTMLFAVGSYAASIAFGIFNGVIGILSRSIWYGALAAYYILLAFLRGGVLSRHGKSRAAKKAGIESVDIEYTNAKNYRGCGVLLLLLNLALSGAIAQMIFDDGHFSYAGWTVYAMAAYAFFKITMSIINIFRAKKQNDMTVRAVRNINFADALVSILALQTALLTTFSSEGVDVSLFNTLTGCAVSLLTLGLGVLMIITGNQKMKEIRENKQNNGR